MTEATPKTIANHVGLGQPAEIILQDGTVLSAVAYVRRAEVGHNDSGQLVARVELTIDQADPELAAEQALQVAGVPVTGQTLAGMTAFIAAGGVMPSAGESIAQLLLRQLELDDDDPVLQRQAQDLIAALQQVAAGGV